MKLSFSSLGCPDYTIDQIVACAEEYGYDGVEIRTVQNTVKLWELPDLSGAAALKIAKKKFDDAGLEIPVVGASGSFAKAGKDHQQEQLEQLKQYGEIAQGLGAPYIRVFGGPVPEGQTMEECVKWDIEGYEKAIPVMEQFGVTLLLETHDSFSKSESLLPIIVGLKEKIGVIWDILHPIRFGEAFEDTARNLKPYIKHVHIKDSKVFNEKAFDFELPGNGSMPIPKLIENLRSISYNGYLSFEWERGWHPEIPSCEVAFPHYINYMRKYM
ncbi:MAG: sugar phosphate isomerase/epimerase [Treponema sp.]|jgi:sugar phosphate isomerase/epimerase|nr:sugar phosphate isomerase/epimerase [Treponema sp.]